jgi:hypothetical protein
LASGPKGIFKLQESQMMERFVLNKLKVRRENHREQLFPLLLPTFPSFTPDYRLNEPEANIPLSYKQGKKL